MPLEGKKTDGVEIDIPGNRVFVVNRDKSISMIDICHDKPSGTIPINASLIVPEAYRLNHREIGNPRNLFSLITDKNLGVMNWISGDIDFRNWVDGKVYRFKIYYVNGAGNQLYSLIFNPKKNIEPTPLLNFSKSGHNGLIGLKMDNITKKLFVLIVILTYMSLTLKVMFH